MTYLRLVATLELVQEQGWETVDLQKKESQRLIREHGVAYAKAVAPDVYVWRNKVGAHFAFNDPFSTDSIGTLEASLMTSVTYLDRRFFAGAGVWNSGGESSQLPRWSLTQVFEGLRLRLWPDRQLKPLPPSRV